MNYSKLGFEELLDDIWMTDIYLMLYFSNVMCELDSHMHSSRSAHSQLNKFQSSFYVTDFSTESVKEKNKQKETKLVQQEQIGFFQTFSSAALPFFLNTFTPTQVALCFSSIFQIFFLSSLPKLKYSLTCFMDYTMKVPCGPHFGGILIRIFSCCHGPRQKQRNLQGLSVGYTLLFEALIFIK